MATIFDLQDRGLRYGVIVDAAATPATLAGIERAGLRYKVEVAAGITAADRAALDRRGLQYFVPVSATVSMADRAILERQGLRYAVPVDADILPADLAILERQGLSYFVEVDSSGNSVATAAGGGLLLTDETNGFATDFLHAVDAERVAVKTAGATIYSTVDGFYANAGTSPKMVYDVAGVLGWSPHNMLVRSEDLTDLGAWGRSNVTTPSATRMVETATTTGHSITTNTIPASIAGMPYCFSVEVTAAECDRIMLYGLSLGGQGLGFDLTTGGTFAVDGIPSGGLLSSGILVLGSGRYRCWIALNATGTSGNPGLYMVNGTAFNYAGNTSRGVTIHRQQLNRGTVPLAYLPTTTAARFGLALDYDPVTHAARGLLCEPAATNLIIQSAAPATQGVTVTAVAHTLSIFGTGTLTLTGASTAGPLVGTGVNNRVSLTFTPTAGTLTLTKSGTVTNAQLETGSVATSVIPTLAATVTRAADSVYVAPASINYSATAGSWRVETTLNTFIANARIIGLQTGTAPIFENSATNVGCWDGPSFFGKAVTSILGSHKMACALQDGSRAITADGLAVATDAAAGALSSAGTRIGFGTNPTVVLGGDWINGYIRKVVYVPRRKTNAELVTETT